MSPDWLVVVYRQSTFILQMEIFTSLLLSSDDLQKNVHTTDLFGVKQEVASLIEKLLSQKGCHNGSAGLLSDISGFCL